MDVTTPPAADFCTRSRSSYVRGCRCADCAAQNRRYQRNRSRQLSRPDGDWSPTVPADQVRELLTQLSAAGMGVRTIAERCGVTASTVWRIRTGRTATVRTPVAVALLGCSLGPAPSALVDAATARRHRDLLVAGGWHPADIAAATGLGESALRLRSSRCRAETAHRLAALTSLVSADGAAATVVPPHVVAARISSAA